MPAGDLDATGEAQLAAADVVVLAAMNHELGTAPDVARLLEVAPSAAWVIDAAQAAAWINLGAVLRPSTLLFCSGRKLGGPAGVGVLRVADEAARSTIAAMRSEPDPSLAAIGMGAACHTRRGAVATQRRRVRDLADRLLDGLRAIRADVVHNTGTSWLGPIVDISVPGLDARQLEAAMDLQGVAISRSAACRGDRDAGSEVIAAAFPAEPWRATSATRWSLGWSTTREEIDGAIAAFAAVVTRAQA